MKLIEAYSKESCVPIGKIDIFPRYFPLPFDKYITIHASSGMPAKNYSYWNEAISLVDLKDYKLIQIGEQGDEQIPNTVDLRGKTELNQTYYIIKNSALHISNDSFSAHVAGHFDIPQVCLYGSTSIANHSPYWFNKKSIFIESHRNGCKPSFSTEENPKTIDLIKPEQVAKAISDILSLSYTKIETIFIGREYKKLVFEMVPTAVVNFPHLDGIINIRGDYYFEPNNIFNQIAIRKSALVVNKPLDINILKQLSQNILRIIYMIEEGYDIGFIKQLHKSGLVYGLVTELTGEKLGKLKLDCFDFNPVINLSFPTKKNIDKDGKIVYNTYFKSQKGLLNKDSLFLSKAHYDAGIASKDFSEMTIIDNDSFWKDAENMWIFNKE